MINAVETKRLAHIAARVCKDWQLINLAETIIGNEVTGALEHLIHEMSHAASAGIEWSEYAPQEIAEGLDSPDKQYHGKHSPLAIAEETRTWAIEWNVWDFFSLDFEWLDLECAALAQSCDPDEIKAMVDHQYIEDLASEVFEDLIRFLNGYGKELQE